MTRRMQRGALFVLTLLLTAGMPGDLVPAEAEDPPAEPPDWPTGAAAYDNMADLAGIGYRRIAKGTDVLDTQANQDGRDWIAAELESYGYEVERQPFTTAECDNCENIVVTINGTLDDQWIVVGAHHDAICYSPPPLIGTTYPGCTSSGAYDDGTGSGALLELARTFAAWNITPEHTWKLGWWDYEEWQGSGSAEGGGNVNVTYVNLDMFALNWPVQIPGTMQAACNEEYWTLYMFTSPVSDWSYYENEGLDVTDDMRSNAVAFQEDLREVNTNLSHPEEWVRVIDDTAGNSDHYNFIMNGHTATWLRGQHQYIHQEGDTCEQTPKHSQTDSIFTINRLAGGQSNVEAGLQTGLDIIATLAWWDRNVTMEETDETEMESSGVSFGIVLGSVALLLVPVAFIGGTRFARLQR
ncbi:MAG TPA: M28 family peptidase [Candidatus Poseidoniales archaeon]|nr:M28 family peptidase [Candidatus Poseidoniales archaeon]